MIKFKEDSEEYKLWCNIVNHVTLLNIAAYPEAESDEVTIILDDIDKLLGIVSNRFEQQVKPTVAEFNTGWIKAKNELPQYYRLIVGRFTEGCEIVWRAKDDDMQDIYTVYNTDKILTNLIDWVPMRKKEIKIGSV